MKECDLEIPWGIGWSCQIIMLFISLGLRGKSESEVKNGSHQLTDRHWSEEAGWAHLDRILCLRERWFPCLVEVIPREKVVHSQWSLATEHKHVTTNTIKWSHHSPFSLDKASNFLESFRMSQEEKEPTTTFIIYGKTLSSLKTCDNY